MKKAFFILSFLFVITSCKIPVYTIGMTEAQFTSQHKLNLQLVEATARRSVYKRAVSADDNGNFTVMYYYFVDGKLVRMQQDERRPDVIIEHTKG
jgi:hypothetical protein